LNAFWDDFAKDEGEDLWNYVDILAKIDNRKHDGTDLDELEAHRFLEKADEAHTVLEMRARLRNTGAIGANERPKNVPLSHYLLFKYDSKNPKLFHELVTRSQGDNQKQIEEAQAKLDAVSAAFDEASRAAAAAAASLKEARSKEDAAKAAEADAKAREVAATRAEAEAHASADAAKVREAEAVKSTEVLAVREEEVRKSQEELEAALAEVKRQEDAYNQKAQVLKQRSEDESVGVVSRNKAKNELAQHLAEDPLPLRQAKLTSEAAVRKAEKATKAAVEARAAAEAAAVKASQARAAAEADAARASAARAAAANARHNAEIAREKAESTRRQAEQARIQAEKARAVAEADKQAADDAVDAAQAAVAEAEAFLAEEKAKPGNPLGAFWWIDRELHEKKKFMPTRKGGIAK